MRKRQLGLLFVCSLVPWTVGYGALPLLPVYADRLGAAPAVAGLYLSLSYLALTVGTLVAGWLSDRLQVRKAPLLVAGLLSIPGAWLAGRVGAIWQLTLLTAAVWFLGGITLALLNILAGLLAGPQERGRVFGVLALANPVALLIGGLASGPIVDRWGFPALFTACALFVVLLPGAALFLHDPQSADRTARAPRSPGIAPPNATGGRAEGGAGLGWAFYVVFAAALIAMIGNFVSVLGRSLAMDGLGFSAAAISSTGAAGGAISLPLPLLVGWLSDRLGRRGFLIAAYLAGAVGLVLLAGSAALWNFWIAVSLMYVQNALNSAVGPALVTDLVPTRSLGQGLALFTATTWIGGVVGFALTGYAVQGLGLATALLAAAALPALAAVLLAVVRPR